MVVIREWPAMKSRDLAIKGLGDLGDGGGTHGVVQEGGERRADLTGGEAAEEDAADKRIDVRGAALIAGADRGPQAAGAGAWDLEGGDSAPRGGEAPDIATIAVPSALGGAGIVAGLEGLGEVLMHAVL